MVEKGNNSAISLEDNTGEYFHLSVRRDRQLIDWIRASGVIETFLVRLEHEMSAEEVKKSELV